jgi:membrane-bound lytic murein transglycosylase A
MQTIKSWLFQNPNHQQTVLTQNKSYIFFKHTLDPAGPCGYFNTVLTPQASIAIDPYFIPLGCLMWLDANHPTDNNKRLQRFVIAQDIGGVIKGPLRADFYWGAGDYAAFNAGPMKSQTKFYILLPRSNTPSFLL